MAAGNRVFAVEDESRNIGSRHIPPHFFAALEKAPLVLLEATDEERVDITLQEYVHDSLAAFCAESGGGQGFVRWAAYLKDSLDRIRRRLGSERHAQVSRLLRDAIARHATKDDTSGHRAWIEFLLHEYYDGMYGYQLRNKADRVVFQGPRTAVLDFLAATYDITVSSTP